MGQKVNPVGFRTGIMMGWKSRWYASKQEYSGLLIEDFKIRRFIKERKEKFIRENFGDEIHVDKRGGDRKSQNFNEGLKESQSLATRIEKQSRGKIAKGTADRLIADLRKKTPKKPDSGSASLPAKERRRAEKLAVQIRTLRETKTVLLRKIQDVDTQEKAALRELKSIGQPHLFGV